MEMDIGEEQMELAREAVAQGEHFFNGWFEGKPWKTWINKDNLRMESPCSCVAGQLCDADDRVTRWTEVGFNNRWNRVLYHFGLNAVRNEPEYYGLDITDEVSYAALRRAWLEVL